MGLAAEGPAGRAGNVARPAAAAVRAGPLCRGARRLAVSRWPPGSRDLRGGPSCPLNRKKRANAITFGPGEESASPASLMITLNSAPNAGLKTPALLLSNFHAQVDRLQPAMGQSRTLPLGLFPEEKDGREWVMGCGACRWNRSGDTFESLSLTPSVDAHDAGHFTITNGAW